MLSDIILSDNRVTIKGGRLNLPVTKQSGVKPKLPKTGEAGDLLLLHNIPSKQNQTQLGGLPQWSLWVCVGATATFVVGSAGRSVSWKEVQLGKAVTGTE